MEFPIFLTRTSMLIQFNNAVLAFWTSSCIFEVAPPQSELTNTIQPVNTPSKYRFFLRHDRMELGIMKIAHLQAGLR